MDDNFLEEKEDKLVEIKQTKEEVSFKTKIKKIRILSIIIIILLILILKKNLSKNKIIIITKFPALISSETEITKTTEKKICLCTIAKNEHLYIKEFVEYYIKLGVNKIVLYDNDDPNTSQNYNDILIKEINEGFVHIINCRGNKVYQTKAYQECYNNNTDYKFLMFFDVDEFLFLNKTISLYEFLSDKKFDNCDTLIVNWLNKLDNGKFHYENKPVYERFINATSQKNRHIKTIAKGGIKEINWLNATPHIPLGKYNPCDLTGTKVKISPFNNNFDKNMKEMYILHFITKTVEEYCNKTKRGSPTRIVKRSFYDLRVNMYFEKNGYNEEKMNFLENCLNMTFPQIRKKYTKLKIKNYKN